MKITQHLLISGQVQGVGFRFFTQKAAERLGVTGWVRNLDDGRVEALLQGDSKTMQKKYQELRRGPMRASVLSIEVRLVEGYKDMKEFSIIEDSEVPWSINS